MRLKNILIYFIAFTTMTVAKAQDFSAKADEYINELVKNDQFSGNVLIAKSGNIAYLTSKGYADYAFNIKNTPATRFRIGSVTKQFTAFSILLMVEQGKIKLTDHISDYIPNYPQPYGKQITIHQLLTHTSGIPNYTADESLFKERACMDDSPEEFIKRFWNKPLDFKPGSKFSYSNSGYYVLGVILDKVSDKEHGYETVLNKVLSAPEMDDSGMEKYQEVVPNLSTGYAAIGEHPKECKFIKTDMAAFSAGAMYSTTSDLYKWHLFLNNQKIVSKELMTKYFTPEKDNYAYGWVIDNVEGHDIQWHNGGIDGFVSYVARYPKDDLFIAILSNYEGTPMNQMGMDLAKMYFGKEVAIPKMPKIVKVDPNIYNDYVGTYKLAPTFDIVVTKEDDRLMIQATGQDKFEVFPESETVFFLKVVKAKVEFIRGENGKVKELILYQNGKQTGVKQ